MKRPVDSVSLQLLNPQKRLGLSVNATPQKPFTLTPFNRDDFLNSLSLNYLSPQVDPFSQKFVVPLLKDVGDDDDNASERIKEWKEDVQRHLKNNTIFSLHDIRKHVSKGKSSCDPEDLKELLPQELLEEADSIIEEYPELEEKMRAFLDRAATESVRNAKAEVSKILDQRSFNPFEQRVEDQVAFERAKKTYFSDIDDIFHKFRGKYNPQFSGSDKQYNIASLARKIRFDKRIPPFPDKDILEKYSVDELEALRDLYDIPTPKYFDEAPKILRILYPSLVLSSQFVTPIPKLVDKINAIDGTREVFLYDSPKVGVDIEGRPHDEGITHVEYVTPGRQAARHILGYIGKAFGKHSGLKLSARAVKAARKHKKIADDDDIMKMIEEARERSIYLDELIKRKRGYGIFNRLAQAARPKIGSHPIF